MMWQKKITKRKNDFSFAFRSLIRNFAAQISIQLS